MHQEVYGLGHEFLGNDATQCRLAIRPLSEAKIPFVKVASAEPSTFLYFHSDWVFGNCLNRILDPAYRLVGEKAAFT